MQLSGPARLPAHDGIRDPLRWSRFAAPRTLAVGTALWVIVSLMSAGDPTTRTAGQAVRAAHGVVAVAYEAAARLPADEASLSLGASTP